MKQNLTKHSLILASILAAVCLVIPSVGCAQSDEANAQQSEDLHALLSRLQGDASAQDQTNAGGNGANAAANTEGTDENQANVVPVSASDLNQDAFTQTVQEAFPLTPEQIIELRRLYDKSQAASQASPKAPPEPVATTQPVSLSPGSTPPVIRMGQGFVTSVVFVDSTGSPWPIAAYDIGDPNTFNVQWDNKGNILMIQPHAPYTYGNLAVRLRGLDTPVMITLIPGQQVIDYRADLRVPGMGPNATAMPSADALPSAANSVLLNLLNGVPPKGSKTVTITGGDGQAWQSGNKLYVRTHLPIISPGWLAHMRSPDGTHAYELANAAQTTQILATEHGKIIRLAVKGADSNG